MQMNEQNIPQKYIDFCKTVATLARELGLEKVGMTISTGFGEQWRDDVQMHWSRGRHGEDSRRLNVTSHVIVRATIES